jgi:hypothetical protein
MRYAYQRLVLPVPRKFSDRNVDKGRSWGIDRAMIGSAVPDAMAHVGFHTQSAHHGSVAHQGSGGRRAAVALLASVALVAVVRQLEIVLNPAGQAGGTAPIEASPTPGFDD